MEILLHDHVKGRIKFGTRSNIVTQALREWIARQGARPSPAPEPELEVHAVTHD
jgi:hypothetical protein